MEMKETLNTLRERARTSVNAAHRASLPNSKDRLQLDLITLALRGKKIGFEKVTEMIDAMVELLKKEQVDDDNKKEFCRNQFDATDDAKKALERSVSDLETELASIEGSIALLKDEIAALQAGI